MQMWTVVMANGTESGDERKLQMWMFVLLLFFFFFFGPSLKHILQQFFSNSFNRSRSNFVSDFVSFQTNFASDSKVNEIFNFPFIRFYKE